MAILLETPTVQLRLAALQLLVVAHLLLCSLSLYPIHKIKETTIDPDTSHSGMIECVVLV